MSKYLSIPNPNTLIHRTPVDKPPYSIPGVILPNIEVHDDLVDPEFHSKVWEYLLKQPWHHQWNWNPTPELQVYRPCDWDDSWANSISLRPSISQPRALFGTDEASIIDKHPLIHQLWLKINERLGNRYIIAGASEGAKWKGYPCPKPEDPNLSHDWRVYANASPHDGIGGNGYVHRDTADLTDETSVTIIWMASPEWYPTWGGEIMFHPEDPEGLTGDHQQFNKFDQQQRNFKIGWVDEGKTVSLKPNRLLVYDGRTLHCTLATKHRNNTTLHRRIVFRARLKP